MNTKLTLSLDEMVIEKAKAYASERKISLSKMIESYLSLLVNNSNNNENKIVDSQIITPFVNSLAGVINLDESFDAKESYGNHILGKYK